MTKKQIFLIIAFALVFLFGWVVGNNAHADVILENTGQEKLNVFVYWTNHPYGCQTDFYGVTRCSYALAVGEMTPGKRWTVLEGDWWKPGREFMIVFQSPSHLGDFQYIKFFTITENLEQVYMNQNAFGLAWK